MGAAAGVEMSRSKALEREVLKAVAEARTCTGQCALLERLEKRLPQYSGKEFKDADGVTRVTKEGKAAVKDAIAHIKSIKAKDKGGEAVTPFCTTPRIELSFAAEDHACDVGCTGVASHNSSDGSKLLDRVSRYCVLNGYVSEVIWYGLSTEEEFAAQARRIVDELIIDDGVESRGHRHAIFDTGLTLGGVGVAPHRTFGHVVVVDLASSILDLAEAKTRDGEDVCWTDLVTERGVRCQERAKEGPLVMETSTAAAECHGEKQKTQWEGLGTCAACNGSIDGGRVVELEKGRGARKYHHDCFRCVCCTAHLSGRVFKDAGTSLRKTDRVGVDRPKIMLVCEKCYKNLDKVPRAPPQGNQVKGKAKEKKASNGALPVTMSVSLVGAKTTMDAISDEYASLGL